MLRQYTENQNWPANRIGAATLSRHYQRVKAASYKEAVYTAKKLCQCARRSFAGVKWLDPATKEWNQIEWAEIDRVRFSELKD